MNDKYISVSKFKQSLAKLTVEGGDKNYVEAIARTLSEVVPYLLDDSPAADVQPVRFARWIDLDNRILCSGCGAGYDDSDEVKRNTYIFCPNCGARMDLKDGERE